jgi:sigma-B regulation protein RsbQ
MSTPLGTTEIVQRNNVTVGGDVAGRPMLFAHGFGCSQAMWRHVAPEFADHRTVLLDYVGAGGSDLDYYDAGKYDSLHGYVDDVLEVIETLGLSDVVFVGHSVSSMVGVLAAVRRPDLIGALVLVGPSPRYVNDGEYVGGFEQADIDGLLDSLEANYRGWSSTMAPAIIGNPERPELGEELTDSFCSVDPEIARQFARVTFLSDNRADLEAVRVPTLILQSSDDMIAPLQVGQFVHRSIAGSTLTLLDSTGHLPHLADPGEVSRAIRTFVG